MRRPRWTQIHALDPSLETQNSGFGCRIAHEEGRSEAESNQNRIFAGVTPMRKPKLTPKSASLETQISALRPIRVHHYFAKLFIAVHNTKNDEKDTSATTKTHTEKCSSRAASQQCTTQILREK